MSAAHRSELELFLASEGEDGGAAHGELSNRVRRCVYTVLGRWGARALYGEIEDIVADVHVRLEPLRTRGFAGPPPAFKTFLYKTVVSAAADAANRLRYLDSLDQPVIGLDGDETTLGEIARINVDVALGADETVEVEDDRRHVERALGTLDPRCRQLLRRFHFDDVPIEALAREERARRNTIEVALVRCRTRLYAAFLACYVRDADPGFHSAVSRAAARLDGANGRIFRAWWDDHRSVRDIAKELGLTAVAVKEMLATAKREVWRLVAEGHAA